MIMAKAAAASIFPKKSALEELIECPLCLHQLEDAYTLSGCLHTFCKACIEEIPLTTTDLPNDSNATQGWLCPVCDHFTAQKYMKPARFINELITLQNVKQSEEKYLCKQCINETEAMWKCTDCKLELCTNCKVGHLRIPLLKDHVIAPVGKDQKPCIDKLISCPDHDKPVELSCPVCRDLLCIKCKVSEHASHDIETIELALERMLPQMQQNVTKLEYHNKCVEDKIKSVREKIAETKVAYNDTRKDLSQQYEKVLLILKENKEQKEQVLEIMENKAITSLESVKLKLEKQLCEGKHLVNLANVTTGHSRRSSLLKQIHSDLFTKVSEKCNEDPVVLKLNIVLPDYSGCLTDKRKENLNRVFGTVSGQNHKVMISENGLIFESQYLCKDFRQVFERPLKKCKEILLPGYCNTISFIDDKLWVPLPKNNVVCQYDLRGELKRYIPSIAFAVQKAHNGDIILAGINGLFVTFDDGKEITKISDGVYSNVSVNDSDVYAFECQQNHIMVFKYHNENGWYKYQALQIKDIGKFDNSDTLHVGSKSIIVSSLDDKRVISLTKKGKLIKMYDKMGQYLICGGDQNNECLIADFRAGSLMTMSKDMVVTKENILEGLSRPRFVAIDSDLNVWVLQGFSANFKIVKYST